MKKKYHGHPMFYKILKELARLHDSKNRMYASMNDPLGNFRRVAKLENKLFKETIKNKPLAAALTLMAKQIDGVYEMIGESKKNTPDSVKDKLMDIAVYSIISIILLEEEE